MKLVSISIGVVVRLVISVFGVCSVNQIISGSELLHVTRWLTEYRTGWVTTAPFITTLRERAL